MNPRLCQWPGCGRTFRPQGAGSRYCRRHQREPSPHPATLERNRVLAAIRKLLAHRLGETFDVRTVHRYLGADVTPQAIARILSTLVHEGVLRAEGSASYRRYRPIAPLPEASP